MKKTLIIFSAILWILIFQCLCFGQDESGEARQAARKLEQCRTLMEQLGPKITALGDNSLADMYASSSRLCRESEQALDKGNAKEANTLAIQAYNLLRRISKQLSGGADSEKIIAALERTDEVIDRISDELGDNASVEANAFIESAREIQRSAYEAFDRSDVRPAAQMTRSARKKAQQAYALDGGGNSTEMISRRINRVRIGLEEMETNKETAEQAQKLLNQAENALENDDLQKAETLLDEVSALIANLSTDVSDAPSREDVSRAIEMTDELIESLEPSTDAAKSLIQSARELQADAKNNFDSGKLVDALDKTRAAKSLTEQAE